MTGTISWVYGTVGEVITASQANPVAWSVSPTPIRSPPPTRSDMAPAIGATKIGASVQGRTRRPAWNGEYPWATWRNWLSRKIDPNIPKYIKRDAGFAIENAR